MRSSGCTPWCATCRRPTTSIDYAARLVRATRPTGEEAPEFVRKWVRWGAGPRAGQSLLLGAKARALLDGRTVVDFDDVEAVALPVLRHRVLVNFQAEADGIDAGRDRQRRLLDTRAAADAGPGRPRDARRSRARLAASSSTARSPGCIAVPFTATARSSASIGTIARATI